MKNKQIMSDEFESRHDWWYFYLTQPFTFSKNKHRDFNEYKTKMKYCVDCQRVWEYDSTSAKNRHVYYNRSEVTYYGIKGVFDKLCPICQKEQNVPKNEYDSMEVEGGIFTAREHG